MGRMATAGRTVILVKKANAIVGDLVSCYPSFGCSVGAQRWVGFVQEMAPESKSYRAPAETPAEASVGLVEPWRP
jgi:hypothetical protein